MTYDAAIFDLDGTLVDTERQFYAAGVAVFARYGAEMTHEVFGQILGTDQPTGNRILAQLFPTLDLAALNRDWEAEIHKRLASGVHPQPGAEALLQQLSEQGMPLAVATSSGRGAARRKLDSSGLARFFDVVVTCDDVEHRKPAPDPYLLAAERLGVDPARCLAFEDSGPGSQSAHAAGCRVVLVPDMTSPPQTHAHHLGHDLLHGAQLAGVSLS